MPWRHAPTVTVTHTCDLPSTGWWSRRRHGLADGSRVECLYCGKVWTLRSCGTSHWQWTLDQQHEDRSGYDPQEHWLTGIEQRSG